MPGINPLGWLSEADLNPLDWLSGASAMRDVAEDMQQGVGPANAAVTGGVAAGNAALAQGREYLGRDNGQLDAARMRALAGLRGLEGVARGGDADILRQRDEASKRMASSAASRGQFDSSFAAKGQGELEAATAAAQQQRLFERLANIQGMRSGIEGQFAGYGQQRDIARNAAMAGLYGQQAQMGYGSGLAQGQNIMAGQGAYSKGMMGAAQATPGLLGSLIGAAGTVAGAKILKGP